MTDALKAKVAERIAARKVLVVVGTGVSLASTGGETLASWKGLIVNGIERCAALGLRDAEWVASEKKKLLEGDLEDLFGVAEQVSRRLGWKPTEPCGGDWNGWLHDTVGRLRAKHPELIKAIRDLGTPIATLNYDNLLTEVMTDHRPITWQRAERWLPVLQGEDRAILHLHGHWDHPSSVVLGIRSYDAVMGNNLAQHLQRALTSLRSLLFVGCSGTLEDQNFNALLTWMREHLGGAEHSHYLLIRESEPLPVAAPLLREARVVPLQYGKAHADLLPFIRDLAPKPPNTAQIVAAPRFAQSVLLERIYATFHSSHRILLGRSQELDQLTQLLSRETPTKGVAIQAIGGMGKTALARECCIARKIWKSYDLILGAQAVKRQMRVETRSPTRQAIRFDQVGTILRPREFLVTVAEQLDIRIPDTRTDIDLESEIVRTLEGQSALFILDNLETMENIVEVLALLKRICSPPMRKALITTRQFPIEYSASFDVLPLEAIQDIVACRQLVTNRLVIGVDRRSELDLNDAVNAIVEVAQGHPLALELLTGKLLTQGLGPILVLHKNWKSNSDEPNDNFLSALCDYVFDANFLDTIGSAGAELLSVIARTDGNIYEEDVHEASGVSMDDCDATLSKLFQSGCLHRELRDDGTVLTMHPITQTYFRALVLPGK